MLIGLKTLKAPPALGVMRHRRVGDAEANAEPRRVQHAAIGQNEWIV
jgi:hypothetical protein